MRYMLLIYSDESHYGKLTEEENETLMRDYYAFQEGLMGAKAYIDGARLHPTPTATTVRVRGGKRSTTDGPFAETKEQLGGYYLIEAPDLDAALGWAEKVPTSRYGSVEVRPLWEME
ncbi:MAG: YciI family protein [Planctomycetota bacterium]